MSLSQGQEEITSGDSLWQRKPSLFSLEDQKDLDGMLSKNLQEESFFDNEEDSINITSDQQRLKRQHMHQIDSTQCNELVSGEKQQQQKGSSLINFMSLDSPSLNAARQFEGDKSIEGGTRINQIWKNLLGASCNLDDKQQQRIHTKVLKFSRQLLSNLSMRNRNLTRFQLNLLDDRVYDEQGDRDFLKKPQIPQQKTFQSSVSISTSDSQSIFSLSNYFKSNRNQISFFSVKATQIQGFLNSNMPTIQPWSILRIIFDAIIFFYFSALFILITLVLAFSQYAWIVSELANIGIAIQCIDIVLGFSTCFFHQGELIQQPSAIIQQYLAKLLIFDIFTLLAQVLFSLDQANISQISLIHLGFFCKIPSYYAAFKRLSSKLLKYNRINAIYRIISRALFLGIILHFLTIGWIMLATRLQESKYSWIQQVSESTSSSISNLLNSSPQILYTASLQTIISHLLLQGWRQLTPYEQLFMSIVQISSIWIILVLLRKTFFGETRDNTPNKQPLLNVKDYIFSYLAKQQISELLFQRVCHFLEYNSQSLHSTRLPIEFINAINGQLSPALRQKLLFQTNTNILYKSPIMSLFSYEFISAIAKYLSRQTYSPGEIIYYEGEQADDYLYFVEEGTIELFHVIEKYDNNDEKNHLVFETIQTGSQFGEFGFLTGQPRESFARCYKEASIFKLPRDLFLDVLYTNAFRREREIFCEIKDDLLFTGNTKENTLNHQLFRNCSACKSPGHSISTCKQIHLNLNREILALRSCFLESNTQQRQNPRKDILLQPSMQNKRQHRIKQNAWAIKIQVNRSAAKIEDCSLLKNKCVNDTIKGSSQNYHQSTDQECLQEQGDQQHLKLWQQKQQQQYLEACKKDKMNDLDFSNSPQLDRSLHGRYSTKSNNLEILKKIEGRLWKNLAFSKMLKGNYDKSNFEFVKNSQQDAPRQMPLQQQQQQQQTFQQSLQLESMEEFIYYKPHENATTMLHRQTKHQARRRTCEGNGFYQYLLRQK